MSPEKKTKSFADRLMAIHNAVLSLQRVPMFREAVSRYGYDKKKLDEGYRLYDDAFDLFQEQQQKYLDYASAAQEFNEIRARTEYTYQMHLNAARLAFSKNKTILDHLGLREPRKTNLESWLKQAGDFYERLLDSTAIQKILERSEITPDVLEAGLALIDEVRTANENVETTHKVTLKITEKRDRAFLRMEQWWSRLMTVANVALSKSIDELEKLT